MSNQTSASPSIWNSIASLWIAFFVGGVLATILWMFQVGVGEIPSWVVAMTALLITGTWGICAKTKRYGGLHICGVTVTLSVIVSFFYVARVSTGSGALIIDLAGAVHHLPLLGAAGGLLKALVDSELTKAREV